MMKGFQENKDIWKQRGKVGLREKNKQRSPQGAVEEKSKENKQEEHSEDPR